MSESELNIKFIKEVFANMQDFLQQKKAMRFTIHSKTQQSDQSLQRKAQEEERRTRHAYLVSEQRQVLIHCPHKA